MTDTSDTVTGDVTTGRRTALITGGSGFVGAHLVDRLRRRGWCTTSFDLRDGHDVRDYEQVRTAVERIDPNAIFHLAAQAYTPEGESDPRRAVDVNVVGTLNVLEAVRHTGSNARLLVAGTSGEYGLEQVVDVDELTCPWPTQVYGATKLAATHLTLIYGSRYGIPVVVTRAYNHTGPGRSSSYAESSFARQIAQVEAGRREAVIHGNLGSVRDYSDVRDVVRAYELLVDAPTGVYNLCSERLVTLHDVLNTLTGYARCNVPTREVAGRFRADDVKFHRTSHRRATAVVGWVPEIPLERTLEDLLNYWRERT